MTHFMQLCQHFQVSQPNFIKVFNWFNRLGFWWKFGHAYLLRKLKCCFFPQSQQLHISSLAFPSARKSETRNLSPTLDQPLLQTYYIFAELSRNLEFAVHNTTEGRLWSTTFKPSYLGGDAMYGGGLKFFNGGFHTQRFWSFREYISSFWNCIL